MHQPAYLKKCVRRVASSVIDQPGLGALKAFGPVASMGPAMDEDALLEVL